MRNNFSLLLLLLFYFNSFSQERISWFLNSLKDSNTPISAIYPFVNEINGDVGIFIVDDLNINGYLLNNQFKLKKELNSPIKKTKYRTIIGSSIFGENNYRLFSTNNNQNKFATVNFSFKNNKSDFKEIDIDLTNERFIQAVNYDNKFYLITIGVFKSIIYIYSFDNNAKFIKNEISLINERFVNDKSLNEDLYRIIKSARLAKGSNDIKINLKVEKIIENNPNSIEITSKKTKLYQRDNKIIFTFDFNKNYTQILQIDLRDYSYKLKTFTKPFNEVSMDKKKTNSYINGDYIFMVAATKQKFSFTIQNYNDGKIIKEYIATLGQPIAFKNSHIYIEGGDFNVHKELEKTKKFLKFIKSSDIGISTYKFNDDYQITMGGTREVNSGSSMMMPMGVASMGAIGIIMAFNPAAFAFNSYTNSYSTFIISRFDEDFKHIKGNIKKNVFDKIKEALDNTNNSDFKSIFKYKNYYILGIYSNYSRVFQLQKFETN